MVYEAVVFSVPSLKKLESRPFITTNLCIDIMQEIKQNASGIRNTPGTTLSNAKGEVIYTPPTGEGVIREKLLDIPAIYLSEYIVHNKSDYYKNLRRVTEKADWEGWIMYMLDMIEQTSRKGLARLSAITGLMQSMSDEIKREFPKMHSKELIEILFKLPYTKRQNLVDAGLGTTKTVGNYLIT